MAVHDSIDAPQVLAALSAEEAAMQVLLTRIDDQAWQTLARNDGWTIHDIVAHIADSTYGIAQLILKGPPPEARIDLDAYNQQRRERLADLPRATVEQRITSGFAAARQAVQAAPDPAQVIAYGPHRTAGEWLLLLAPHIAGHRSEIEQLLARRKDV